MKFSIGIYWGRRLWVFVTSTVHYVQETINIYPIDTQEEGENED